jgi:hypothetical protein
MTTLRYDRHPSDGMGVDSGAIGQAGLVSRYGLRLTRSLALGIDVGALFPGAEKPADALSSPAIDARALAGWLPDSGLRLAAYVGYRFDYTSGVGGNAPRYRPGDRLALGVSDFDAVLAGLGTVLRLGSLELLGELTADIMVGQRSPSIVESPWRADLGVRQWVSRRLQLELLSEVALNARPSIASDAPLVPVEPRISIALGMRYQFTHAAHAPPPASPPPAVEPALAPTPSSADDRSQESPPAALPATGHLVVSVFDHEGHPLSDAAVELVTAAGARPLQFRTGSTFEIEDAPVGAAKVWVKADLMRESVAEVEITKNGRSELRIDMSSADVSGQIRGQVRAFDGRRLAAHVLIEPGTHESQAGPDGTFSMDVPPGKYKVKVWMDGFQPQERSVQVSKRGVTVLNLDLQKGK